MQSDRNRLSSLLPYKDRGRFMSSPTGALRSFRGQLRDETTKTGQRFLLQIVCVMWTLFVYYYVIRLLLNTETFPAYI